MGPERVTFGGRLLPAALIAPQLLIVGLFFYWPAVQAVWQSFQMQDAFGLSTEFVWFENYRALFTDPAYYQALVTTLVFAAAVAGLSLGFALLLATMADREIRGSGIYRTLLIWPYAVAPAVAGVLFGFLFQPGLGLIARGLNQIGIPWNPLLDGNHAMILVVMAAAWKQVSYNFLFFLAGLQAIPGSVIEAAAIDGAGPARRFWTIIFPLLSPTTFFLMVVNVVYAFCETFGVIDVLTHGGPGRATQTLVYKVYQDGRIGADLGGSAAQSVVLMAIVIGLTAIQFRYVEKRVAY
ncbi:MULTISPECIES: sn-glycerol-3-phosphate ABC transporter permease UgpA [Methylobacterium]|jgi:sn-glycerol 3-phosphate transport system permease protein|uniref:sn-glycerol-3-phosphate transport system permease protein UgpA n=2 Tax=Methylobacterium TaxID=407 RepID=A0A0C6FJ47_9HYPH|nr:MULTISPECIES: sn-glycerol-3-phosphate ABC transporter permease UgpA [Methylobacterium]MBK3395574.1 sn-glycerol-3-phosphate ABC transporter permease UgpA [Methylobacterium ajmalii]MBK3408700.1 sn-glycerol-3-phosphate ABC transporter permease UgpA [Methylobacterium ajmalii]MBK3423980.1 sn-glycerol-3-phosphate ABC transporter permease UgpA [Methylobacterium ajmalii]MBZ6415763.1 sn-glycerol-3-phosphate ABC transporter permease UgpA [Methylobacterium sp.]SFE34106.1 carbohydrate ABC transporter m